MFAAAAGVQFAVRSWSVWGVLACVTTATMLSMGTLCFAVHASSARLLVVAALLAGDGRGLGQLGGLTLIGLHVPDTHRAEASAVISIGGYLPAGLLLVMTGYAIDFVGLPTGATLFSVALAGIAPVSGGAVFRYWSSRDAMASS